MDVLANNDAVLLLLQNLFIRIGKPYSLSLRAIMRLYYIPPLLLLLLCVVDEDADLVGQDEGLGKEVVFSGEAMLHLRQVLEH